MRSNDFSGVKSMKMEKLKHFKLAQDWLCAEIQYWSGDENNYIKYLRGTFGGKIIGNLYLV